MPDDTQDPTPSGLSLDDVLAQCIAAEEDGRPLDRQLLAGRYPQHAADLAEFFSNRDRMQRLAAPLRNVPDGDSPAGGSSPVRRNGQALGHIRYFGDYELQGEIAAGGMGIVYKARQVSLNRIVAVKMILKGTLATDEDVRRFRAEAEAAANLQHPGIVAIHEVGMHEGQHYFSMDYVEGASLAERMRDQPLPGREAARYVSEAAQAVHYAHQQGTLHRDLKPSNLLIDRHDRVRITDFGLAKRIEDNSELTLTGQILGTPSYMPPEQALGKRSLIGAASDVYALGAVLYELLAGRPPFRGETPAATLRQVETLDPVWPRLLNPATPRDLETICLKCLEKEPHKRYGTAQLLADDLGRFLRHEPILARPISSSARAWQWCKRKPAITTAALAICVALVAVAGGALVFLDAARVGAAYRNAEAARQHAEGLSTQLQSALGETEQARDNEASLRTEKEAALVKLQDAYGMLDGQRATTERALKDSEKLRYQLQIVSADRAIHTKEVTHARELLQACPESMRSWEWHYMQHLSAYEVHVCLGLAEPLREAALAPGGNSFFGVTAAGRLIHWDLAANAALPLPEKVLSPTEMSCVAVHSASMQLALGDRHGQVQVINLETGVTVLTKQLREKRAVSQVAFREDGAHLAAVTYASVHVLSTNSDRVWVINRTGVNRVALHPYQGIAYLGSGVERRPNTEQVPRGQWLAMWRYEHDVAEELPAPESTAVTALALNADGSLLTAGTADGGIQCWRLGDKWTKAWELKGHDAAVRGLHFCEAGQKLASSSDDQTVRLWSVGNLEPLAILREHQATVGVLDVGQDGKTLLSAGGTSAVLWNTSTREGSLALGGDGQAPTHRDRLVSMDIRPDGGEVAAASLRGNLYLLDTEKLELTSSRRGSGGKGIAYSLDSRQLVLGGMPPVLVDLASDQTPGRSPSSPRSRIALTPDRTRMAIGTGKGVAVYRLANMSVEQEFPIEGGAVIDAAFLADGKRLATASNSSMTSSSSGTKPVIAIWDLATRSRVITLEGCTQTIWDLDASPDQRFLAAAGGGGMDAAPGELKVWNVETGKLVFDLAGHQLPVWSVAFSPDGRRSGWSSRSCWGLTPQTIR